ncbi:MAG: Histidine kinase-, DNA gyrase B-, and [Candidatus Kaiserbacteria bacterium GW2011_GWC2_49_12]|uniref:Histidine kinase-, DNA gyrase B-, and n=1 Tax=Candidatus Kaiserbacteria bacterium GW2011_GWC2_49_12 TaxID=1618675 RepID=A0A0G1VG41_9BACT|nr:MAG: Histidine kinase-, DNA gyrase B-, and [Candidatus Kaiserbacteria bacterium GW2011_GWC2_49_12]
MLARYLKSKHFRFSVKDNGIGITPEDMKNLFTEGGHGKESIKTNVHSTGAESDGQDKGARFIVELPAA